MSEKRRPPGEDIANIFVRERHESETNLLSLRKEQEEKQLSGCTFSPAIIKSGKAVTTRFSLNNLPVVRESNPVPNNGESTPFNLKSGALNN